MSIMEEHYRTWYYRLAVQGLRKVFDGEVLRSVSGKGEGKVYFNALLDACERNAEICREVIEFGAQRIRYFDHKRDGKGRLKSVSVRLAHGS